MTLRSSVLLSIRYLLGERVGKGRWMGSRRATWRRIRGGVIGVGLSLVPLVVVLEVANGMIAGITERFLETGSSHVRAIARFEPTPEETAGAVATLSAMPGVRLATPERQGVGLAAVGESRTGVTIRAVDPDLWSADSGLRTYLDFSDGSWMLDDDSILLGEHVARALSVQVGGSIRLLTARPLSSGRFVPRSTTLTVRGVFSTGYSDLDRLWVLIPYERGLRVIPDETAQTVIAMKVEDPRAFPNPLFGRPDGEWGREEASAMLEEARSALGGDWRLSTWFESERAKYMSFKTTKDLLVLIMVLIVIVAAVNISSSLVMLVLEKQEEIAILKSLGASPRGIMRSFMFAGFGLGVLGTVAGCGAGLLLAVNINAVLGGLEWLINALIAVAGLVAMPFTNTQLPTVELLSGEYYLEVIPITLHFGELFLIALLTVMLATAAAFFPARRAAQIRPLEVLRKH
jgi:lipoprotein-releasing system permease protein